jgi:acyl-coenzyme A thioesterase PaaI-like protein
MVEGTGDAKFGEAPLAQTVAAAAAMRRLSSTLLALEQPHAAVDAMLVKFAEWESELAAAAPRDNAPRIGEAEDDPRRVYLNHATDIGAYNPCFPEYSFDYIEADKATGRVLFPLVYEGPPGLVHGGFLAVFFDCVMQHQSCVTGLSGKTRSLNVTFRRPTPILTELRFDIVRSQAERAVTSTARVLLDDEVLCLGEVNTLASAPEKLSVFQFGRRRKESNA